MRYGKVKKKKGGQKPTVTEVINTICNVTIALTALASLIILIVNQ